MRSRVSAAEIERLERWLANPFEAWEGWPVCKQYNVRRGEIVAGFPPDEFERWDIYWPLEETPDLYLTFARLHEELDFEQAALSFARDYGLPDGTTIRSPYTGWERPFPDRMELSRLLDESRWVWIVFALYESVLNHDVEQTRALVSEHQRVRSRRRSQDTALPPGQYFIDGFPVLSAGPTPRTPLDEWDFSIVGEVDEPRKWTWEEFRQLPSEEITKDIHCVTKWSKLGTRWEGVSIETLLDGVETAVEYVTAFCDGDYTTNLPLEDVTGGKACVAYAYEGEPLEPEHGGPARPLVPHLYFWKSVKCIRGLQLTTYDVPGFWESLGYLNHGDPWREQRYWGD